MRTRYHAYLRLILLSIACWLCETATAQTYERRDVTLRSEGLKRAVWYSVPTGGHASERRPAIVMAHGWGAAKEMMLENFASANQVARCSWTRRYKTEH